MEEWPVWRLVEQKIVTLAELESSWGLDDIMRANAVLDISDKIKSVLMENK